MSNSELYIACEEMNFVWYDWQITSVISMWKSGKSIPEMAKSFKRTPAEVVLLLIDLNWYGRIKKRPGGIFGNEIREG